MCVYASPTHRWCAAVAAYAAQLNGVQLPRIEDNPREAEALHCGHLLAA